MSAFLQAVEAGLRSSTDESLLDWELHAGQQHVKDRILDSGARMVGVVAHRRWGKNWLCIWDALERGRALAAERAHALATLNPLVVIWFVFPTYDLGNELWSDLRRMVPRGETTRLINSKPQEMDLAAAGGGVIRIAVRSADHPETLVSAGVDLLYMIEAARMKQDAWLTVRPTLVSHGRLGRVVFNSTPLGQNWFARLRQNWEGGAPGWAGITIPAFEPDGSRHPLSVIPSDERLEQERRDYPERWFRQEYLAEFLTGEGAVFREVRAHIASPLATPRPPIVVGVDLAKRADFTVFAAFDADGRMAAFDRMGGIPYPQQSQRLCSFAKEIGAARVIVETNGPGEAFLDMAKADAHEAGLRCEFEGVATTATSKEQMINALAVAFERPGGITLLDDPVLVNEFEAFSASQLPSGRERLSAPEGGFDDCVMACAIAFSGIRLKTSLHPGMFPKKEDWRRLRKSSWAEGLGYNLRRERDSRRS